MREEQEEAEAQRRREKKLKAKKEEERAKIEARLRKEQEAELEQRREKDPKSHREEQGDQTQSPKTSPRPEESSKSSQPETFEQRTFSPKSSEYQKWRAFLWDTKPKSKKNKLESPFIGKPKDRKQSPKAKKEERTETNWRAQAQERPGSAVRRSRADDIPLDEPKSQRRQRDTSPKTRDTGSVMRRSSKSPTSHRDNEEDWGAPKSRDDAHAHATRANRKAPADPRMGPEIVVPKLVARRQGEDNLDEAIEGLLTGQDRETWKEKARACARRNAKQPNPKAKPAVITPRVSSNKPRPTSGLNKHE